MASAGASASVAAAALPLRAPGSPLRPPEAAYRGSRHAHTGSIVYPRRVLLAPRTGAAGHAPAAGGPAAVTGAAGAGAMAAAAPLPSFLCNMAAGAVGRAVAVSVTHPIDTLKTRMQVQRGGARQGSAEALRGLLATSGVGGLYAGLDGSLVGQVPSSALAFAVYELARGAFSPLVPPDLHVPFTTACGSLGGLVGTLLVVPSEVVKTRLQTGVHATAGEAAGAILQEEGWAGFYRGCGIQARPPGLAPAAPEPRSARRPDGGRSWCGTCRSGRCSWRPSRRCGARPAPPPSRRPRRERPRARHARGGPRRRPHHPLDVVKARPPRPAPPPPRPVGPCLIMTPDGAGRTQTRVMAQQRQAAAAPGGAGAAGYRGAGEALVRIAREEGPGALLRGLGPRVLAVAPMSALFLSVYETLRASLAAPAS
eukprot:tig00000269_g23776.t1